MSDSTHGAASTPTPQSVGDSTHPRSIRHWLFHRVVSVGYALSLIALIVAAYYAPFVNHALFALAAFPTNPLMVPLDAVGASGARIAVEWTFVVIEVFVIALVLPTICWYIHHLLHGAVPRIGGWTAEERAKLTPEQLRDLRRRQHVVIWVFLGAMASGLFTAALALVELGAFQWHLLSVSALNFTAQWVWPFVCLAEILLQIIPMIVRQQTRGWDIVVDQWTSYIPAMGCVVLFILGVGVLYTMDEYGWVIWSEALGTAAVELALLALGNQLIPAARGEEVAR